MKKIVIAMAVGAAAVLGGSAANAGTNELKANPGIEVSRSTDVSARSRHHHWRPHYTYRQHYRHGYYRPYYNSYGAYQRPYGYYGSGPGVSFSFGSGGYRGW